MAHRAPDEAERVIRVSDELNVTCTCCDEIAEPREHGADRERRADLIDLDEMVVDHALDRPHRVVGVAGTRSPIGLDRLDHLIDPTDLVEQAVDRAPQLDPVEVGAIGHFGQGGEPDGRQPGPRPVAPAAFGVGAVE